MINPHGVGKIQFQMIEKLSFSRHNFIALVSVKVKLLISPKTMSCCIGMQFNETNSIQISLPL